jgi:hypothetical protein
VVTLDGAPATVAWVHTVPGQAPMVDLTVANDHTFAVGDSQSVVHNDDGTPELPPFGGSVQAWRYAPGTAWGGSDLLSVYSVGNPADYFVQGGGARILVPREVAEQLQGNFYEQGFSRAFKSDFWQAMYNVPEMRDLFSPANQALMASGRAPFAQRALAYPGRGRYEINHIDPIEEGGPPLDLGNMEVLAPRTHVALHQQGGEGIDGC